ncbi:MAG: 1,4-alpha-glucan branching protein GlgB [Propionibacteriaceae bacterium]
MSISSTDLSGWDFEGFHSGGDTECWKRLGSHLTEQANANGVAVAGTRFTVWAPNARAVRVKGPWNNWDGSGHELSLIPGSGIWGGFVAGVEEGAIYRYDICDPNGTWFEKVDPMARYAQSAPDNSSIVTNSHYQWRDQEWLEARAQRRPHAEPMSIYEVHLGSWRKGRSYRDLAIELVDYVRDHGFTHVEFMPIAEHPFEPSWGYQITNYFAPTSRFGSPDDLRYLIDAFHQADIGVILDWVPGHFPKDGWALGRFDGTALYEHADPRQGEHMDWGTYIFNYGRNEVKSFLVSNALYWAQEFHIDGLRVDAVASMLYLDYSRQPGEWVPNIYGGNENLEAINFLKYVTSHLYERCPGIVMIAEESTSFPGVTAPADQGGLGFGFKWNMGWMNDSLRYLQEDPLNRPWHHHEMTFAAVYAFNENYILPISHDEVVHGKGSMINKIPQDWWRKFATLRAFYAWQWAWPGKELIFMGQEFAQWLEFNEAVSLDWALWEQPLHAGLRQQFYTMNTVLKNTPALYDLDSSATGFEWLVADDSHNSCYAWLRSSSAGQLLACVVNFSPNPLPKYRVMVPRAGNWKLVLSTDWQDFGGDGIWSNPETVTAVAMPEVPGAAALEVTVPPLGALWFVLEED